MNILIVEQDDARAAELAQWLKDGGFCTNVAATQDEALQLLADHHVQVLILSEHPAVDAAHMIKFAARSARIPAIILGNVNSSKSRVDALALGADCYLPKPFSPREVLACVRVLARSTALRAT